jgi:hypothetical protein
MEDIKKMKAERYSNFK